MGVIVGHGYGSVMGMGTFTLLLFHNWRSIYSVEQVAYEAENGHFSFAQLSSLSSFHHFVTPTSPNPRPVEMAAARSAAPTPEPSLESIVVTLSA